MNKPRSSYDTDQPVITNMTVHEPEDAPQITGLLDKHGNPLYRMRDKIKIGFV
jgi:hypothetical protein